MKYLMAILAFAFTASADAITRGTPIEYDGLLWGVTYDSNTAQYFGSCGTLNASVISTFAPQAFASVNFVLNCSTGAFSGAATGYINISNGFSFSMRIAGTLWNCAVGLSGLSGNCTVYDANTFAFIGNTTISFE